MELEEPEALHRKFKQFFKTVNVDVSFATQMIGYSF
jgi:hypothetical protein